MPAGFGKAALSGVLAGILSRDAAFPARDRAAWSLSRCWEREREERRPALWLPVAAGTGVLLYLAADREPVVWLPAVLWLLAGAVAWLVRGRPFALGLTLACLALVSGFIAAELRARTVATPMLDRVRIVHMTGRAEEVDRRPTGARVLLSVIDDGGLDASHRPRRVRLTARRWDTIAAGDVVAVTARLLPPSHAALPGGYDFARDAFFSGIGAVGSVLGAARLVASEDQPGWPRRFAMAIDRGRNALAARVDAVVGGGDVGAIAAAMVTGKRDLLSRDGREVIRQAGIFHIITIAGVQMTLVAGLLFGTVRRLLALSTTLALRYPIKSWAAAVAILGAIAYDLGTGSRVGTQRAFFMTLVMLGAVIMGRRALTMRNLAIAALAVVVIEPEQIAGASFQLSFAAVAALIAVQEARMRHRADASEGPAPRRADPAPWKGPVRRTASGILHLLLATLCATAATASFMASEFHELSPYVFVGNPLTLAMIEFFAVPSALVGTVLYPLGLDAFVWHWLAWGIEIILWLARMLAGAPASTVHVPAFAPWALPCLALAFLNVVIWRTTLLRLTAVPLLVAGLAGAVSGPRYDLVVAPTGDAVGLRGEDGRLGMLGKASAFTVAQWLGADGDARDPQPTPGRAGLGAVAQRCDKVACVARLPDGQTLSLVNDASAFRDDCRRATLVVTSLVAPASCGAEVVIDRLSLEATGAVAFTRRNGAWMVQASRAVGEDRPWSPAPVRRPTFRRVGTPVGSGDIPATDPEVDGLRAR